MASSYHSRSNSFPSQFHPIVNDVQHHLERLMASSQATSTSSVCANLAGLRDLHDSINTLVQMTSIQQAFSHEQCHDSINELLDGSLRSVDLCGFSRDIVQLTNGSLQDLESSVRRQAVDVNAYVASRKTINKMVNKCIKNLIKTSSTNRNSTDIGKILREAESLNLSVLRSVLILLSGEKEKSNKRSWALLSKKCTQIHYEVEPEEDLCSLKIHKSMKNMDNKNMLNQLKATEKTIQEIEEGLRALFRSLVKTRVSLLNVLSH